MNIISSIPKQTPFSRIWIIINGFVLFLIIAILILLFCFLYSISVYALLFVIAIIIVSFFVISLKNSKGIIKVKKCLRDNTHPMYNLDRMELDKEVLVPWSVVFKSTFLGYCSSINSKNEELDFFFAKYETHPSKTDEQIKNELKIVQDILDNQIEINSEIYPTEEERIYIAIGIDSFQVSGDSWILYINKLTKKQESFKCVISPRIYNTRIT
jgi:hypothetical protein